MFLLNATLLRSAINCKNRKKKKYYRTHGGLVSVCTAFPYFSIFLVYTIYVITTIVFNYFIYLFVFCLQLHWLAPK